MALLRVNEYWGKRASSRRRLVDDKVVLEIWVKRGATGAKSNSGPTGRALRRKQRTGRVYANRKQSRPSALGATHGISRKDLGRKQRAA